MSDSDSKSRLAPRRPVLLVILDGFGASFSTMHNAVALAKTPNFKLSSNGGLANIAPTVLQLMGLQVPKKMASSLLLEAVPGKKTTIWKKHQRGSNQRRRVKHNSRCE